MDQHRWHIRYEQANAGTAMQLLLTNDLAQRVIALINEATRDPGEEDEPARLPRDARAAARNALDREWERKILAALGAGHATQKDLASKIPGTTDWTIGRHLRRMTNAGIVRREGNTIGYRQAFVYSVSERNGGVADAP